MQDLESMFLSMETTENTYQQWENVEGYSTVPYSDDNIVYINNKEVGDISANIVLVNESYSQYVQFEAPRYEDGVDLITKRIYVHWEQGHDIAGDNVEAVNVKCTSEFIRFGFVVPASALTVDDEIRIMPFVTGEHNGNNYVLKTLYGVLYPQMSLNTMTGIPVPNEEWFLTFERKMSSYVEQGTQLLNETKQSEEQTRAIKTFMDDSIFAMAIVNEESGELIQTKDAANMALYEMSVFGKSKQGSTTGAQLLNTENKATMDELLLSLSDDKRKITVTAQKDGVMYAFSGYTIDSKENIIGKTITLSVGEIYKSPEGAAMKLYWLDSEGKAIQQVNNDVVLQESNANITVTITDPENDAVVTLALLFYASYNNASVSGGTSVYEDVMVCLGNTPLPWEPYTGGKPSPNPDYPQEIESVGGGSGSVVVKACGKNLLQITDVNATKNGVTFITNDDGTITANGTSTERSTVKIYEGALDPGTYIFSQGFTDTIGACAYIEYTKGDKQYVDLHKKTDDKFTITERVLIKVLLDVRTADVTVNNLVFKPMLRHVEVEDDTFEPYTETSVTLTVAGGLLGIPVTSGGNYTNSDGQQYIADEIRLNANGTGKWVHNVEVQVFDGSEDELWNTVDRTETGFGYGMASQYQILNASNLVASSVPIALCNQHMLVSLNDILNGQVGVGIVENVKTIRVNASEYSTNDITLWTAHLAENPMTLYYQLAEPYETDLSAEEVEAFLLLRMNKLYNTVFNDANVYQRIKYIADPKTYINNKIAEAIQTIAEPV